jgi:hypothetical protein
VTIGNWIAAHPLESAIAAVLALVAAVLIEVFKFAWRNIRNLISPTSIQDVDRRIQEQLEWRRILTNEKALYLSMFRALFGIIMLLCTTASTFILSFLTTAPEGARVFRVAACWMLILVGFICTISIKTSALDSKERLAERLAKIDKKIEELRERRAELSAN